MHFYMLFEHICYEMCFKRLQSCLIMNHSSRATYGGGGGGGGLGNFYLFKRSIYSNRAVRS